MKKIVSVLILILLSVLLCAQVAKVKFIDGTTGFAVGPKLTFSRVGDTLAFESLDQKIWQLALHLDPSLIMKSGVIQKIFTYKQEVSAKFDFIPKGGDLTEDWAVSLFNVGDTIQVVKRKDAEGEDMYKVYFGRLPGNPEEETQRVIIRKFM
jgi:hypothetical protein